MKSLHEGAGKDSNRGPPYRRKITAVHKQGVGTQRQAMKGSRHRQADRGSRYGRERRTDSRTGRRREHKGRPRSSHKQDKLKVNEETRT